MRLYRSALAGIALGALLPVAAAQAAAGVSPAGNARSSATLVHISVGGLDGFVDPVDVAIGTLTATAGTTSAKAPSVSFVPLVVNGAKKGAVTVTPANSPLSVGGMQTGNLGGLVSATSPAASLKAADGASRSASLGSDLGSASLLGLPITIDGGLTAGSLTDATRAEAGKALSIKDIALPNVADLLAAVGIDLAKLPAGTLNALASDLRIAISAATQQAIANANAAIATATQAAGQAEGALTMAQNGLVSATGSLNAALSGATIPAEAAALFPEGVTAPLTAAEWAQLSAEAKTLIEAANAGLAEFATAYDAAVEAVAGAEQALAAAEAALAAALKALADLVEGLLAGVPLVRVGAADIGTKAAVTGAAKSADVTGTISGVTVLGSDILADVTGDSTIDVAGLVGEVADDVNAALNTATNALSNALSDATGATGLVFPAPKIELMAKRTSTSTDGAYGVANAAVTAFSVSLGSVTVPTKFALAEAPQLPGLGAISDGFQSAPFKAQVGTLSEAARFRPGTNETVTARPGTPSKNESLPALPSTGGPAGLAIVAVIGTAAAVGVRRHLRARTE